ncbi:unnamed protein product, partial [Discosporangium mesarthrocarpum]
MSRGRPAIGNGGASAVPPDATEGSSFPLSNVRAALLATRELPCFESRPESKAMIDNVLDYVLPAAMAEETAGKYQGSQPGSDSSVTSSMDLDNSVLGSLRAVATGASRAGSGQHDHAPSPNSRAAGAVAPVSSSAPASAAHLTTLAPPPPPRPKRSQESSDGSMSLQSLPDRAWTIMLDFLDLKEGMRCRCLGQIYGEIVVDCLSVLALSGVSSLTWATPKNLRFLTRFKNVRTLHWYVGVGIPPSQDMEAKGDEVGEGETGAGTGGAAEIGAGGGRASK